MSDTQIEARRLSDDHIGRWVTGLLVWPCEITSVNDDNDFAGHVIVGLRLPWLRGREQHCCTSLAPTDVVTLTGTTPSEEGS